MWSEKGFWSKWQLRFLVVLSLFFQIILVWLGKRRRRLFTPLLNITIWSAYLAAGWFATVSLSTLLRSEEGLPHEIIVFWTPFLILHLGGPDTITAYSLEDTEIWLRHLLGLVIQVGTALYINYKFRSNSPLQYIALLILIAGLIKYGERIWILRFASSKQFENFVLTSLKKEEDWIPKESFDMESNFEYEKLDEYLSRIGIVQEARNIYKAFISLKMFSPLILNLSFRLYPQVIDIFTMRYNSVEEAFSMVDTELGFIFDVLYTKTLLFHTLPRFILRCVCSLFVIVTLFAFSFISKTRDFSTIDIFITYLLLVGDVFLDTYAILSNVFSHWTMTWFNKNEKWVKRFLCLQSFMTTKGLGLIGQHNVIDYCINANEGLAKINIFDTSNILQKFWHSNWIPLSPHIQTLIYAHLLEKRKRYKDKNYKNLEDLLNERGRYAIQLRKKWVLKDFHWSLDEVIFDHSL